MKNKVNKLLLTSVMSLSGVAGAVGTASIMNDDPVVVQASEQTSGPSVTIQGKYVSLPTTIYVVKRVVTDTYVNWNRTGSNSSLTEIATIELTDEASLSQLDSYKYKWSSHTDYPDEYDESNYNSITTYTNEFYLTKTGTTYSNKVTSPGNNQNYSYTYDAGDSFAPVVSGQLTYTSNIESPVSLDDIKANLKAVDETDGDVELVVVEDNYSSNSTTKGTYTIKFSATDNAGNTASCIVTVIVVDTSAPVISGPTTVTRRLSSDLTVEEIKGLLEVTDNTDTLELSVDSDNYTSNKNVPGTYQVIFSATDSSGNKSTHTVSVKVIDDVKPVITGPSSHTKNNNVTVNRDYYLSQLEVSDNVDSLDLTNLNIVSDSFSGNADKVGTYQIVVNITDESGNTSDNFTITIKVDDKIPPVFWANGEFYVIVEPTTVLSTENIAYIARALGIVDSTKTAKVELLSNAYYGNESISGEYDVVVKATYEDGSSSVGTITLAVNEELGDTVIIPADKVEKEKSTWDKIKSGFKKFFSFDWLKNGFKKVLNFIKSVGNWIVDLFKTIWDGIKWFWNKLF